MRGCEGLFASSVPRTQKALSKEVKSEAEITGAGELKVNNHTQAALFS